MAEEITILLNLLDWHPKKIKALLEFYGLREEVVKINESGLRKTNIFSEKEIRDFSKTRDSLLKKEIDLIKKEGVDCIDIFDSRYPLLLREIPAKPLLLYTIGDIGLLDFPVIGIVGSRKPTSYGAKCAAYFSYGLACEGFMIASGLAKGIDSIAHQQALKANSTIAVLGSGLSNIYPRENKGLAENIKNKGLLISEFPMHTSPIKENFPRRNRIVSGLSQGVLVVEAAKRSGALITAHTAIEQNRDVFAIPGNIDSPLSKGTHSLIKEGAKLVDCLEDILEELCPGKEVNTVPLEAVLGKGVA